MLLEELDENKKAIFNPDTFVKKKEGFPKTAVSIFSKSLIKDIVETYKPDIIGEIENATAVFPVYKININGVDLAVYQSPVGAPACINNFEEIIAMGAENLLLVGCCGCLEADIEDFSIIIPDSAIRDEGASYHYLPVSDEIKLNEKCVKTIEDFIKSKNISYRKGKTWTTDAAYRETKAKTERRKSQGAITVEMECASMAAVAQFRGVNFCQIFYAADNLGGEEYDPRSLIDSSLIPDKKKIIPLALECGAYLDKSL